MANLVNLISLIFHIAYQAINKCRKFRYLLYNQAYIRQRIKVARGNLREVLRRSRLGWCRLLSQPSAFPSLF